MKKKILSLVLVMMFLVGAMSLNAAHYHNSKGGYKTVPKTISSTHMHVTSNGEGGLIREECHVSRVYIKHYGICECGYRTELDAYDYVVHSVE